MSNTQKGARVLILWYDSWYDSSFYAAKEWISDLSHFLRWYDALLCQAFQPTSRILRPRLWAHWLLWSHAPGRKARGRGEPSGAVVACGREERTYALDIFCASTPEVLALTLERRLGFWSIGGHFYGYSETPERRIAFLNPLHPLILLKFCRSFVHRGGWRRGHELPTR